MSYKDVDKYVEMGMDKWAIWVMGRLRKLEKEVKLLSKEKHKKGIKVEFDSTEFYETELVGGFKAVRAGLYRIVGNKIYYLGKHKKEK